MSDAEAQLRERAESDGVRFFFAMFVDMHGKPCAKMIPVEAVDVLTGGGAGFAGFAAGPMGQSPADPDMIAVPDPASYTLTPWQPELAVLQCDIHVEGQPWPYTPRLILKRMLDKVRDRGLVYNVGCEAEYFLVRRRDGGGVWDAQTDAELFADPADPRGLGLSELAYHYIGGLIEHGPAMAAVTCPTVNSYKRFGVGAPNSGATWAPAYATYGGNNRTQMLRVPDGGRVENRACDGSANPYLAMAVQLAAGLDGIDRGLDPGEPNRDNLHVLPAEAVAARGIRALPPTLLHAADELVTDDVLREAMGKTPDGDYIDYYAQVKRDEFRAWHSGVSDWEVERYLTLF
jgi:glutamine synthetase